MIKQYKQIKKYPNSYGIGSIAMFKEYKNNQAIYKIIPENDPTIFLRYGTPYYFMTESEIKNYPEFWEPILDFETYLYKATDINDKYPNRIISRDDMEKEISIGYQCNKYFDIFSVKRISTNEYFNVGDIYKNKHKIIKFEFTGSSGMLVHLSSNKIINFDEL